MPMAVADEYGTTLGARIKQSRHDAGFANQADFAAALKVSRSIVAKWEINENRPRHNMMVSISEITNKPLQWLESGIGKGKAGGLPIIGRVAAGVWKEGNVSFVALRTQFTPRGDLPVNAQELWEVEGTSINKYAVEGELLHGLNFQASGLEPQPGTIVIVRRLQHDLAEYTAKMLVERDGAWALRPYSNDPSWQQDIELLGDEATEIEIVSMIIGKWTPAPGFTQ